MRKILSLCAAMLVAFAVNAGELIKIDNSTPDALRLAVEAAGDGDIIEMEGGLYIESPENYIAFTGKSVTVRAAEGAEVILQPQVPIRLKESATAEFIGIKFDCGHLSDVNSYENLIVPADDSESKTVILEGCEFFNWKQNAAIIRSTTSRRLSVVIINNCFFHDVNKSCLFLENTAMVNVEVRNSTFANVSTESGYSAGVIDVRATDGAFIVDHCTFYNVLAMNTDYAAIGKVKVPYAVVSNSIFMLPSSQDGMRAIRDVAEAKNCFTFNYEKDGGWGIHSDVTKTDCHNDLNPLFADADNGDFTLDATSPALTAGDDGKAIGDPRWWPATPVVEYYLVSNIRGMDPDPAYKFEPNPGVDGEFMLSTFLYLNEEIQGLIVVDGVVAEVVPSTALKVDHANAGYVDIYFRPEGNLAWPLYYVWIDVTDPLYSDGFYLITEDWTMDGLIGKFNENPGNPGEYMLDVWLNEGDKLKVVKVEDFEIKTWYPDGMGNEYVVDAAHAGDATIFFKEAGDAAWSEFGGYMDIVMKSAPVIEDGFYLVGEFSDWKPEADLKFEPNTEVEGEYILRMFLMPGEEVRGAVVLGGEVVQWVPAGENIVVDLAHAGDVLIHLNPAGNPSWEWTYVNIEVLDPIPADGYYLIGPDWTRDDLIDRFVENIENPGEFMMDISLDEGDKLKVVKMESNTITAWYPDGEGTEYTVDAAHAGDATIYFKPDYNDAWKDFGGYMFILMKDVPMTAPDALPAAPTSEPYQVKAVYSDTYSADCNFGEWGSGTAYAQEEFGKKYVTGGLGYFGLEFDKMDCSEMESLHMDLWIANDASIRVVPIWGGPEQGIYVSLSGQQWNSIEIPLNAFDMITDWSNVYQIKIDDAADLTFWLNNVYFYTTQTKTVDLEDGYYLIGIRSWDIHDLLATDKFEDNPGNPGEMMLFTHLDIDDEFKVVSVASNAIAEWFPGGEKPNYKVDYAHAGDITVYFRPDYAGASDWHEGCIYVPKNADACPFTAWFAIGDSWTEETDSYLAWDPATHVAAVHINIDKYGQWRAQVKWQGPIAEEGKCYRVAAKMKSNHDLENVTLKWQDDVELIYESALALSADVTFDYEVIVAGKDGGNGVLVLDFGFAKAGDIIEISDVVIEEVTCPSTGIDITITSGVDYYDEIADYGYWQIEAQNENYYITLSNLNYITEAAGTYAWADMDPDYSYAYDLVTYEKIEFVDGSLTVVENADGSILFFGSLIDGDDQIYNIYILYEVPVIPETLTATGAELEIYPDQWSLQGQSDEGLYFGIVGYSDEVAGVYTAADLDDYYTWVTLDGNTWYDMTDANLVVTYESNVITVKGMLELTNEDDASDVITLTVDVQGTYTDPTERHYSYDEDEDPFDAEFATVEIDDTYFASYGVLLVGGSDESGALVSLEWYSATAELAAGTYPINNSGAAGSIMASSGVNSSYQITGSYATDGVSSYWFIVAGTVTVAENGVITVSGLNSYNLPVTAKIGKDSPSAIENSNVENETVKTIENGQLRIRHNGKIFNANGARIK